jgi:hypothetical protein
MIYYFCLNDIDIFALTFALREVIQAEIVCYGDLYLCAMFLTVHDKPHVKFHQPGPCSLSTLNLNANVSAKMSKLFRQK